jgi:hypothetical protein
MREAGALALQTTLPSLSVRRGRRSCFRSADACATRSLRAMRWPSVRARPSVFSSGRRLQIFFGFSALSFAVVSACDRLAFALQLSCRDVECSEPQPRSTRVSMGRTRTDTSKWRPAVNRRPDHRTTVREARPEARSSRFGGASVEHSCGESYLRALRAGSGCVGSC